ncbi:sister chromatid cohesion protein DCC1 [Platysternon megacephalum]|uniref:Sister chromatid cohesion protein DCC1 n=1 Tax=Platysternon megacephalum TaxID=55544 RepID=A0A4D9EQS6_9SAUR|nr:sister chromatid cohesion protein DCC1 [Platysternon megacephalum]
MSVSATESDPPRFFVGGEDGDELLDSSRSADFDHFYDHAEEEDEEYDSDKRLPSQRNLTCGVLFLLEQQLNELMIAVKVHLAADFVTVTSDCKK